MPIRILEAELVASAAGPEGWPAEGPPEVAVLGRSNVGKSSLLNRLVARRKLARTSATPGKTRLAHFFRVVRPEGALVLVDLPGYGYAKVSRTERAQWRRLVEGYLEKRGALAAAILLQDLRRDPGEDETLLLAWLAERRVPTVVALTKLDKLRPSQRARRLRDVQAALGEGAHAVVATSAQTGAGVETLWEVLDGMLAQRTADAGGEPELPSPSR